MSRHRLVVTDDAELDIAAAHQWYEEQQAGLGLTFIACVDKQLELIELQPLAIAVVVQEIRRLAVTRFPYNIYFAINDQVINVLAVWHGSRDQERLLSQLTDRGDD